MIKLFKSIDLSEKQLAWISVSVLFIIISCTYLLKQIIDPDFFWHLKTGEWIWQNGSLPQADPFTFTGPQNPTTQQLYILQGYPLAQLLYNGLYQAWGWTGIFLLRYLLTAVFLLLFMARFSLSGFTRHSWLLASGLMMLFCDLILDTYPLDRPQVFSFLFFGILLLLYEWVARRGYQRPRLYIVLSSLTLMTVWANTQGLSMLGLAILAVIAVSEIALFLLKKRSKEQFFAMTALVLGGLSGCFLSSTRPDLSVIIATLGMKSGKMSMYNNEYLSAWKGYQAFSESHLLVFFGLLALVLVLLLFTRSLENLGEMMILIGVGIYACVTVRYVPFFAFAALPFVYAQVNQSRRLAFLKYGVAAAGLLLFAYSLVDETANTSLLKKEGAVAAKFPVAAADFVIAANLQGHIFNYYNSGGYLLWRLAPQRKIFQDGRGLDERVFMDGASTTINMRGSSGMPLWQEIMDKYNICVAIVPMFSEERPDQRHPLSVSMSRSSQWRVIYYDSLSMVFQRMN